MTFRVPDDVHSELLNWSRWCWDGPWPHPLPAVRCGSAEGAYRAPPSCDPDLDGAPPQGRVRINTFRAMQIHTVWQGLPPVPKAILKAEYPARMPDFSRSRQAAAMGITMVAYEDALRFAVQQAENEIEVFEQDH